VLAEVENLFGVPFSSMVIMKTMPEDFLMLPDLRAVDRVFNRGLPLIGPGFSLYLKRWTRHALASSSALPAAISVELRGVSTHAWEKATM
jgi:hypothetical protein